MKRIIALIGPSGSGKTYIVNHLLGNQYRLVTHTTRPARPDEKPDQDYFFEKHYTKTSDNLLDDCYAGNYYWTKKSDILIRLNQQNLVVMIITKKGYYDLASNPDLGKYVYGIYLSVNKSDLIRRINDRPESESEKKIRLKNLDSDMFSKEELDRFSKRKHCYVLNVSDSKSEKISYCKLRALKDEVVK